MSAPAAAPPPATHARVSSLSVRDAAAYALRAAMLAGLEAVMGDSRVVKLHDVFTAFPTAEVQFKPPCGSIEDISEDDDDDNEVFLDASYDQTTDRALLATEGSGVFQIDLWGTTKPERRALKAAFRALFRGPGSVGGSTFYAPLPDDYLPPGFRKRGLVFQARFTLTQPARDIDDGLSVSEDEWQAQGRVTWDAEVVTASDVQRLDVVTQSGAVVTDIDNDDNLPQRWV